ncbi:MAG: D-glycero-alpha-D-manno-heptose-1,7-bisphosphate 7-phosphatase [Caulobacteraceae bacterium]
MTAPAIFLDRDGVLVEEISYTHTGETEAPLSPDDVRLLPGVASTLARLRATGFTLIVISNQGGFAKGKTSLRALWLAHERFLALLQEGGARLDGAYYSYSHPEGVTPFFSGPSLDRKPGPYNVLVAAARHDIDLSRSWMIGDRETDVECGRAAGVRTVRIAPHRSWSLADVIAPDFAAAAMIVSGII